MASLKSNIPSMSVGKFASLLASSYSALINSNQPLSLMPSVMLWGAPGVGKSQGVRQMAKQIEKSTGKTVNITDVRLLLFNPIDLRGIPTANAEKTLAVWLKPKIFDMNPAQDIINVLFLDELSAAPQSVQAAAYQITLDRVIGEHRLPDNCIVIAAGNRMTDKSVVNKMPRALANRLMHIEVDADFKSWVDWAVGSGIHPMVVGFLKFREQYFIDSEGKDELAFPTPRTWEMVSNVLNNVSDKPDEIISLVGGLVGMGIAVEFKSYFSVYKTLPTVEDIFSGKARSLPTAPDVLYALTASMNNYARKCKDDLTKICNSINYAMNMSPEFSAILLKGYMGIEDGYKAKLMKLPIFLKWLERTGKYL